MCICEAFSFNGENSGDVINDGLLESTASSTKQFFGSVERNFTNINISSHIIWKQIMYCIENIQSNQLIRFSKEGVFMCLPFTIHIEFNKYYWTNSKPH